jgi:hypothetical protein
MAMASAIGRPIKVDINTLKVERGRFARVCVEVDLTMPVVGKIWVNGHWYKVQYEGLHIICTNCGCYGHLGRNCPLTTPVPEVEVHMSKHSSAPPQTNPEANQKKSNSSQPQSTSVAAQNGNIVTADLDPKETNKEINNNNNEESKELHGDWLLVTRRKKQPNQPSSSGSKTAILNKSNKFNVLSNLAHQASHRPATQNLPPRPHATNIARPNNGNTDPKRRRHDVDNNNVTITPSFPTSTTTTTPNNLNKSISFVPPQSKETPHTVSDPKNSVSLHHESTTRMNTNKGQNTYSHEKDYNTILTPISLVADPPDDTLTSDKAHVHDVDDDLKNGEKIHVRSDHNEEDMVS